MCLDSSGGKVVVPAVVLVLKGNAHHHDLTHALDVQWNLSSSFCVLSKFVVSFLNFAGIVPAFS